MRSTRSLLAAGVTALDTGFLGSLDVGGSLGADTSEFDLQAHRGGLGLHVESSPQAFSNELELGVDGIITDYPDRLRGLMEQRGMELPRRFARES